MSTSALKFIGWFLAVAIPAALTYWVYWKEGAKGLAYSVVASQPLTPPQTSGFPNLKLVANDKRVLENPYGSTIKITNIGNQPLQPSDFVEPLVIQVRSAVSKGTANAAVIVQAVPNESEPPGIPVHLDVGPTDIRVKPLLLNEGDTISVAVLTSDAPPNFTLSGRVTGVSRITEHLSRSGDQHATLRYPLGIVLAVACTAIVTAFAAYGIGGSLSSKIVPIYIGSSSATFTLSVLAEYFSTLFILATAIGCLCLYLLVYFYLIWHGSKGT